MKILIVSKCPTHPTDAGNRAWICSQANMLRRLGGEVHFLYVDERPQRRDSAPYLEALEMTRYNWGKNFHCYKVSGFRKLLLNLVYHFRMVFCGGQMHADDRWPHGLEREVERLHKEIGFDIVIVNYYYLSKLFLHTSIKKQAIATHDCFAYKNVKTGQPIAWLSASGEAKALQRCAHIFALQDVEAGYFKIVAPQSRVYCLYDTYQYKPSAVAGNHNLLFLSSDNPFNCSGIRWFVADVLPAIRRRWPDARLLVGGRICKAVPELAKAEGVVAQGYVESADEFYNQGDVAINPVSQGTGLKIKTFEAIAHDKVAIVHPHSMDGVFRPHDTPLFASTDPSAWVEYLEKVWGDRAFIERVKASDKEYISAMSAFVESEYRRFLEA